MQHSSSDSYMPSVTSEAACSDRLKRAVGFVRDRIFFDAQGYIEHESARAIEAAYHVLDGRIGTRCFVITWKNPTSDLTVYALVYRPSAPQLELSVAVEW